jgi:hypothetical protein
MNYNRCPVIVEKMRKDGKSKDERLENKIFDHQRRKKERLEEARCDAGTVNAERRESEKMAEL